jgi:Tfp pilus assembly protein PilV
MAEETLHREPGTDSGMSLVELMIALAIFLFIMGVVTTAAIMGFRTIATATALSDISVQQQNALLWTTRLLRYADNPSEGATPTSWVVPRSVSAAQGASGMTFYTYSGTGPTDGVPYRVTLTRDANANIVSRIVTPQEVDGYDAWCWEPTDAVSCSGVVAEVSTRVLVNARDGHTPGLTLTFRDDAGTTLSVPGAGATDADWSAWAPSVDTVIIRVFDQQTPTRVVEQTVRLENPR